MVRVTGMERTVDLGDPNHIRPTLDVSDRVRLGPDGHPTFNSIAHAAREVLADIKATMMGNAG